MLLWALKALGWLKSAWGAVVGLIYRYPWQAVCVGLVLACVGLWHGKTTLKQDLMVARAQYAATIARQNAAIAKWQADGQAMQARAATALADTKQANRPLIATAQRIDHTAPPVTPATQAACPTPPDVMAAKEQL